MELPEIKSVTVKSLGLPAEVEPVLQKIADGGPTRDLDTPEEFKQAAEKLKKMGSQMETAIHKLHGMVVFENGEPISYRVLTIPSTFLLDEYETILVRRNLQTGEENVIHLDVRGCGRFDAGHIEQLVTNGREVYVVFDQAHTRFHQTIGKVVLIGVPHREMERRIQFINIRDKTTLRGEFDLAVIGARVYVSGKSDGRPVSLLIEGIESEQKFYRCPGG